MKNNTTDLFEEILSGEEMSPEEADFTCEEAEQVLDEEEFDEEFAEAADVYSENTAVGQQLRSWLRQTTFKEFCDTITERVKGQRDTKVIAADVYVYIRNMAYGRRCKNNILLAAPSGCGKTETYRAIRDYFAERVPALLVYQIDMTSITEEGYKGKDTSYVIAQIQESKDTDGIAIVFLDEFDKKLMPSYTGQGTDVNAAIQAQILTMVEGRIFQEKGKVADTSKTLFIGLGAFAACREKKAKVPRRLGFHTSEEPEAEVRHYTDITREDMIELGASYELIGRFSEILNYHELDEAVVSSIIDGMLEKERESLGCGIELSDEMRRALISRANGKFGCRMLNNIIHDRAMKAYVDLLYKETDRSRCTIHIDGEEADQVHYTVTPKKKPARAFEGDGECAEADRESD